MAVKLYRYRFSTREGLIVQIDDGWGEIAPLPGFSKETLEEARRELIHCLQSGAPPTLPSVRWGLTCASQKYDSSPLSLPLCAFKIPFPGSTHLKLKSAESIPSYLGKYRLRLDCNRSWTLEQALRFAEKFDPKEFDYLEEPVANFEDLKKFSEQTAFPIAVDESFREGAPYWELPSLVAVVIKPMLTGHIPHLPYPVVLSSSFETSLGILQIARKANPHLPHGLHTFANDLLDPPLQAHSGRLHASEHRISFEKLLDSFRPS